VDFHVPEEKLTGYLLNPQHPVGRGKAAFFLALGFSRQNPEALTQALVVQAREAPERAVQPAPEGEKLICIGPLATPSGKRPWVVSVWYLERGKDTARLVTAYPYRRREDAGR
jgi:filamentous hemagglutinin